MGTPQEFYFSQFEDRRPEPALQNHAGREFVWQVLAVATIALGVWYLNWRWTSSLNPDALWFAVPVAVAETLSFIGLLLFFYNLWAVRDTPRQAPPETRGDCVPEGGDAPPSVDVFITTYDEEPELVRLSIRDAMNTTYPHRIWKRVHVLDDGKRPEMRRVAIEEGANYITRDDNTGMKAGNLRNAMEHTFGDFIVICDADTRLFPSFIENTLGYFRDHDVAWVQTPQWFYDLPEGERLPDFLRARLPGPLGGAGALLGGLAERLAGPIRMGRDPFGNDPKLFYDVILRRRNRVNASFCCGAGSIHRREAVVEASLRAFAEQVGAEAQRRTRWVLGRERRVGKAGLVLRNEVREREITPYKFHVSEDIYTSMLLQGDRSRNWKSVLHPEVEARMLSPQDLLAWAMQRFKYAGGTLDIMLRDNPLFRPGMSLGQKLMYAMTFWSYLAPIWICVFLMAPIVSLLTGIAPVDAYSTDFFVHLLPFILVHELALVIGMWGVDNRMGKLLNLAFFWLNLKAMWTVLKGEKIRFHVTPKMRTAGRHLNIVRPHLALMAVYGVALGVGVWRVAVDNTGEQIGLFAVNAFWSACNMAALMVLIRAAWWRPPHEDAADPAAVPASRTGEALA